MTTLDDAWVHGYRNPQAVLRDIKKHVYWSDYDVDQVLQAAINILEANDVELPAPQDTPALSCDMPLAN